MFSDLWNNIKELVSKMLPKQDIEKVLHVTPVISDKMANAIQLWANMYEGKAPWLKDPKSGDVDKVRVVSLGLPSLIASEKARMVTLEMKSEISAPMEKIVDPNDATKTTEQAIGSTERADYLNSQYKKLLKQIRKQLEYGIAKGGLVIKPYPVIYDVSSAVDSDIKASVETSKFTSESVKTVETTDSANTQKDGAETKNQRRAKLDFDYIQADRFFPLSFDANGNVVEAAFIQTKTDKAVKKVYTRLEYHKLDVASRTLTVQNLAFESTDMGVAETNNIKATTNLGNPIPLTNVPEWADFEPSVTIKGIDRPLFAYFKMPEANTIDPYSPLGVSGYSRVIQLIQDADEQYSRLLWEFEGGELAIDVDRDALKVELDANGNDVTVLPQKQDRLFRKIDLNNEETYEVFAPQLRDDSLVHGLNIIFMRIEDACGLSRGTLSDVNTQEAKTATELKILKQRSFATNADIQTALQDALEDVIYIMDVYCTLYELTPPGEYEASFEWDDSIIVDNESELSKRLSLQQNGLASRLENRMWYYGETENQAKAALQQIDEEAREAALRQAEIDALNPANNNDEPPKSPADTTKKKISKGKQADSLNNPDKSKTADQIKG